MKRRILQGGVILMMVLVGALVAACAGQPAAPAPTPVGKPVEAPKPTPVARAVEKVKLQVPSKSGSYLNYYLPREKGMFKEEGIDLEIVPIKATLVIPSLLSGEVDYAGQTGGPFEAGMMGQPVKVIATFQIKALWYIFGATGVTSLEQLKGKSMAVSSIGSSAYYAAKVGFRHLGLDPDKDISFVAIPDPAAMFSALKSKSVAAAGLISPFEMAARDEGLKEFLFTGDILEIPLNGLAVTDLKLKQGRDQAKRMIRVSLKGLQYIKEHPEEAIPFLAKEFGLTERVARATYQDSLRLWSYDGTIPQKALDNAVKQGRELGTIKGEVNAEKGIDFSILKEVQKEMGLAR